MQELHIERTLERGLVGNIYWAAWRGAAGHAVAFVDIGRSAAFLHVADVHPHGGAGRAANLPVPIERRVFEGQT